MDNSNSSRAIHKSWEIRRAKPRDAGPLTDCIDAAYIEAMARLPDLPEMSAGCAEEIENHQVWVATIGPRVVAGLVLMARDDFMILANIAVHPDHQGSGLGRAMLAIGDREAAAHGYDELRLTTHRAMLKNIGLYSRLGWRVVDRQGNKIFMNKTIK